MIGCWRSNSSSAGSVACAVITTGSITVTAVATGPASTSGAVGASTSRSETIVGVSGAASLANQTSAIWCVWPSAVW